MSVQLKQNPDLGMGLQGTDLDEGGFIVLSFPYNATAQATVLTLPGIVCKRRMIVTDIKGVPETASTNAVTATVYKAASGTAIGSGTALHSGSFNLQGTPATNQSLTLSTTAGVLDVTAGSRIGVVISGAMGAAGNGCVTVTLTPA
ncbi:MAG: hypothetical protein KGL39_36675 [Patescibacteria group bacterium]|nr:hypothetical protein [Patescibacteria group bacterium]